MTRRRRKKPKCYQAHGAHTCLGKPTRALTAAARCRKCKWLEKGLK